MLCPNCKTELIEVNGRYICSDCGKEVPENEVMTSDWGNSTPAANGIYDAAGAASTPEEGSMPVATFETPVGEPESAPLSQVQSVEEVLQDQTDDAQAVAPAIEKTPEVLVTESVEAVLQEQADAAAADRPVEVPPINLDISPIDLEPAATAETPSDSGFYVAPTVPVPQMETPEVAPEVVEPQPIEPVIPVVVEEPIAPVAPVVEPEPISEPIPVVLTPEVQGIPVNVSTSEMPAPIPEEANPAQPEVVKDMFEDVPAVPVSDPGLYANTFEDSSGNNQQAQPAATSVPTLSVEKRTNILILAIGSVLALCLIGGGTWAYIALSKKAAPVVVPVIDNNQNTAWQELQIVDAGFKISFPGQPDKAESTQNIGGLDIPVITESYTTDDAVYTVSYATVNASADKLPTFVDDLAKLQGLDVVSRKVGTYFAASAIDFTLSRDSASYQGKIMLKDDTYILVMAGSSSGQTVDFSKFIKSFSFVVASTGDTTN